MNIDHDKVNVTMSYTQISFTTHSMYFPKIYSHLYSSLWRKSDYWFL